MVLNFDVGVFAWVLVVLWRLCGCWWVGCVAIGWGACDVELVGVLIRVDWH